MKQRRKKVIVPRKTKSQIHIIDIKKILIILFVVFSLMPTLCTVGDRTFKILYLIFAVFLIQILKKEKAIIPNRTLCMFLIFSLFVSMCSAIRWGVSRYFFNYIFGFLVLILISSLYQSYSRNEWLDILQIVWWIALVCVVINDIKQYDRFVYYFAVGLPHPYIDTLITGGPNLEATWMVILSVCFFDNRKRWIPYGISLGIALLYGSRTGLILAACVFIIFFLGKMSNDTKKKILMRRSFLIAFVGIAFVGVMITNGQYILSVIERFTNIGDEPGSLGRLAMWEYFVPVLQKYPLGVGLGNSIDALETISPLKYTENNMHCLYMQMFVDCGVIGGIFYLAIWGTFIKKEFKNITQNSLCSILFLYAIAALMEFGGGESMFFCVLGIFLSDKRNYKIE